MTKLEALTKVVLYPTAIDRGMAIVARFQKGELSLRRARQMLSVAHLSPINLSKARNGR